MKHLFLYQQVARVKDFSAEILALHLSIRFSFHSSDYQWFTMSISHVSLQYYLSVLLIDRDQIFPCNMSLTYSQVGWISNTHVVFPINKIFPKYFWNISKIFCKCSKTYLFSTSYHSLFLSVCIANAVSRLFQNPTKKLNLWLTQHFNISTLSLSFEKFFWQRTSPLGSCLQSTSSSTSPSPCEPGASRSPPQLRISTGFVRYFSSEFARYFILVF